MRFVLDASVAICWLLSDGKPSAMAYSQRILDAMQKTETGAIVPAVWSLEVTNVLARAEAKGMLTEAQSGAFLELLSDLDIIIDTNQSLGSAIEVLELARRHQLSSYDSSYLRLAIREGLSLATLDEDLQKAAKRAGIGRFS